MTDNRVWDTNYDTAMYLDETDEGLRLSIVPGGSEPSAAITLDDTNLHKLVLKLQRRERSRKS